MINENDYEECWMTENDHLAELAEEEERRQIAIESRTCMHCGAGLPEDNEGQCGPFKCWGLKHAANNAWLSYSIVYIIFHNLIER